MLRTTRLEIKRIRHELDKNQAILKSVFKEFKDLRVKLIKLEDKEMEEWT